MRSTHLVLLALLTLPSALCAQDAAVTDLISAATSSANPSLTFLQGLGQLDDTELNGQDMWRALDVLSSQGIAIPPSLTAILNTVETISVSGSSPKTIRFTFNDSLEPISFGMGYAHISKKLSFELTETPEGVRLNRFRGFKLSKKPKSFKVRLKSVRFQDDEHGNPVALVDAGLGGKHTVSLVAPAAGGLVSQID